MGKLDLIRQRPKCDDRSAPICGSACCTNENISRFSIGENIAKENNKEIEPGTSRGSTDDNSKIKELLIIGAGPHSLSLLLRLLEPDADLLSDKERHLQAESRSRMRPVAEVYNHIRKLLRGPSATLRTSKKKKRNSSSAYIDSDPPPLSLETIRKSVLVVDKNGDWLSDWKQNFQTIGIKRLRSLMNAHADPYDHRSLEYFAEIKGRGEDLVTLPSLSQRDKDFRGPYQAPSTSVFNDFHDLLLKGYGIEDIVQKGTAKSINPVKHHDGQPIFEVNIDFDLLGSSSTTISVKARRVVCAMGPIFHSGEAFWEASLKKELLLKSKPYPSDQILHPPEIVPYLKARSTQKVLMKPLRRLLIVGGGITSAQLALLAAESPWCDAVKLIQRSRRIERHFDIENKWMGPRRGQLLENFWSLDMQERAQLLQEARRGGSIPPETLKELFLCQKDPSMGLEVQEEVQISKICWENDQLEVTLDDGSESTEYDMIWLATGAETHIDFYSALSDLRETLPVDVVNGLPVLNQNLTWRPSAKSEEIDELQWKKVARERFWCMGLLAGLELGPDALNLVGARQGAVRVARDIRRDMKENHGGRNKRERWSE